MSFLRKVRNSISRGNSSTRDSTPNSRRSSSIETNSNRRRDSVESKPDGLQRSETFTIDNANESILAKVKPKPTKKQKVANKFGTFTRSKISPDPPPPSLEAEEIKDKTYYSWKSGIVADPAEAARDPFNVLYEQPSSLQSDLSGCSDGGSRKQVQQPIDSSTFRKNRVSRQLREQLEQLKNPPEISEEIENDPDKFRTITLNSFRRSFREKFLSKQNEVPHNPSWFVGVDPPPGDEKSEGGKDSDSRSGVYVYENESYRPMSRSPVRNRTPLQNMCSIRNMSPVRDMSATRNSSSARNVSPARPERPARSNQARSSVKRTETFRVERPPPPPPSTEPSIRIEIKNSISPNQPGRMVPVGVAKPMPSQAVHHQQQIRNNRYESPNRGSWNNHQPSRGNYEKQGRYQTCIQITSNDAYPIHKEPTRVRISGNTRSPLRYIVSKRNDPPPTKRQTYFGDNMPMDMQYAPAPVKPRQYTQQSDFHSYNLRPSRQHQHQTSGMINRNEPNRYSMTQSVPRRSRSPIKVPWR
ncbi:uncharacterized protein LOC129944202 [Eupeodes corollae]|uniref:uncharacterized protein LOC129944202 n=1 Tax=Eupeodes corollae TaxID=290404 RepID=UPI002493CE06|nr:uncharacterized protein LOC129944202 [Eupeodes corollae]